MSDPKDCPLTRRHVVVGAAALPLLLACAPSEAGDEAGDQRARWQAALDAGDLHVPAANAPHLLSGPVRVPGGRTLSFAPGARVRYAGCGGTADRPAGVFLADGDGVTLTAAAGEVVVECDADYPFLYAVLASGVRRLAVIGVRGLGCGHVRLAATKPYAAIATSEGSRDVCRDVTVRGGGASFRAVATAGEGACYLGYAIGWTLEDAHYERVAHGVQWWGGNAWPGVADGAAANERKCRSFAIRRVRVTDASQAGLWGSMGQQGVVEDCHVERCGDVGIDAEGCVDITFSRCSAIDATNGCFATFFLNRNVVFADCSGTSSHAAFPLFRVHNVTQSSAGTGLVAIRGGRWTCTDPAGAGVIDTAAGPTARLEITGATLTNVRIDTAHFNMHDTRIAGNRLAFPRGLADAPAIRAGAAKTLAGAAGPGTTTVEGNRISAAAGTRADLAILAFEDDYNSSAAASIRHNAIAGPWRAGVAVENASANPGVRPRFAVEDNRIAGPAPLAPAVTGKLDLVAARNRR